MLTQIRKTLKSYSSKQRAKTVASFFKTGKGEYSEGDIFIGVSVPDARKVAKMFYKDIDKKTHSSLLKSAYHEERLCALLMLVEKFQKSKEPKEKKQIVDFYLKHKRWVNNWDLVDLTAAKILGAYLLDKDRSLLQKLAASKVLWDRRIAVVASYAFIREGDFEWTLHLSKFLLKDKEDLMHKACGWMLREVGKKNKDVLVSFLDKHGEDMPRVMWRYARERL